MKLSEVLENNYVIPLDQGSLITYLVVEEEDAPNEIQIMWTDTLTQNEWTQYFLDQEIRQPAGTWPDGTFLVLTTEDEPVCFVALTGKELFA